MKKINYLLGLILIASVFMFSSCSDEDALGPEIVFKAGSGYITADANVLVGQTISFSWEVNRGDAALDEFTVRLGALDLPGFPNTDIDRDQYEDTYSTSLADDGSYTFTFIATDKDGLQDVKTINITVSPLAGNVVAHSFTLGSYDANEGSSFASVDGQVYTWTNATANSSKIDFLFFYGVSNAATIAAPNDAAAQTVFTGLSSWTTKNATLIKSTSLTVAEFDAITDDSDVITEATGASNSKITQLAVGDVFAFQTAATSANASKYGLAKVNSITGTGGTATINLAVKIQE